MWYLYYTCRCSSLEIYGTKYRKNCWLLIGKHSLNGVTCPTFGRVVDILCKGEQQLPLFVIQHSHTTAYLQHMRAYSVHLKESVPISLMHPSSLLYSQPFTVVQKGTQIILKAKVDLYSFLESTCTHYV